MITTKWLPFLIRQIRQPSFMKTGSFTENLENRDIMEQQVN